jgi:hypothetical protein
MSGVQPPAAPGHLAYLESQLRRVSEQSTAEFDTRSRELKEDEEERCSRELKEEEALRHSRELNDKEELRRIFMQRLKSSVKSPLDVIDNNMQRMQLECLLIQAAMHEAARDTVTNMRGKDAERMLTIMQLVSSLILSAIRELRH